MPRYYFIIELPDYTYDDSEGERLPSDAAAKDYGHRVVRELKEADFESAGAILQVRDESGQTIHSIPFWLPSVLNEATVGELSVSMKEPQSEKVRLDSIRSERERLVDQIRQSEQTIKHSQELLKRIDRLLAKAGEKP